MVASSLSIELDVTIDQRFVWIDKEAERLAELAGGDMNREKKLSAPWVNVLALRYYLVKLLRVIEFFSKIQPPRKGERVHVVAERADREDVAIVAAFCRRAGAQCTVQWCGEEDESSPPVAEQEEGWRKTLRRLVNRLPVKELESDRRNRVILCGTPRFLDPVCRVLHERECRVWWLYDRLAVKPFVQWYRKGIEQLTCQDDSFVADESEEPIELPKLEFRGMDLRPLVSDWLKRRLASRRHDQRRWQSQIERHFQRIKPDFLVMDEDATPMKRIALAVARRNGGKSYVVQHGAPVARFGFAPLAADGFFAWGRSTREQLQAWDIPAGRIHITGSPAHDSLYETLQEDTSQAAKANRIASDPLAGNGDASRRAARRDRDEHEQPDVRGNDRGRFRGSGVNPRCDAGHQAASKKPRRLGYSRCEFEAYEGEDGTKQGGFAGGFASRYRLRVELSFQCRY